MNFLKKLRHKGKGQGVGAERTTSTSPDERRHQQQHQRQQTEGPKSISAAGSESQSTASPVRSANEEPTKHHRGLFHRHHSANDEETEEAPRRKASISDSGPFVFAFDPNTGTTRLQRNPHWPNEDSWKVEDENEWSFARLGR